MQSMVIIFPYFCTLPIKALLGQKRMKQPYPYPSEDEAYSYIMENILEMGDAKHRKKGRTYYDVRRLKDEGKSIAETARHLGIRSQKVYQTQGTDKSNVLNSNQKQAMKVARRWPGSSEPAALHTRLWRRNPLMALVYLIADGIAARCDEQAEEYLWAGVFAVLRESAFAQLVFLRRLKIQRRQVVEANRHLAANDLLRMLVGYLLDNGLVVLSLLLPGIAFPALIGTRDILIFLLHHFLFVFLWTIAEIVKETVDFAQAVSHMKVAFQIVHGLQFAAGVEQTADNHVAEHLA